MRTIAVTQDLTMTLGDRRYRAERDWAKLPGDDRFGFISDLAVDSEGRVYVAQRTDPPILVFDPAGAFLGAWGDGEIVDPHGLFMAPDDRLFVVDRDAHQVLVFDCDGRRQLSLCERHAPRHGAPFNHPTDAAVAPDGEIYVTDGYGNTMVHRFAADGRHIASWGRPGSDPGTFSTPHAIWIDPAGRVLVADRENNRIQIFDRSGRFLYAWGGFYHPMDIWADAAGAIYVTDQVPRLYRLAADGTVTGRCRGAVNGAHGIWGDTKGHLFLAELPPGRITRLVPMD